jgi:membrane protein
VSPPLPGLRRQVWPTGLSRSLLWRCVVRFGAISGYDRALGLAAQAFIAAIPTVIVAASMTDRSTDAFTDAIIDRLQLSGTAADLVRQAFLPADATSVTVWGACLLIVSGVGFTRALQRAFRAAWGVHPSPGWRAWLGGLGGALVLAAAVAAGGALATVVQGFDGAGPVVFVLRALVTGVLWLLAIRLLLGWSSRPWRRYVPGAVVAGVGTAAIWLAAGIWLPRAFTTQAAAYGLIGIFVVVISWLIVLALLLVVAAVVSAELWHARSTVSEGPAGAARGPTGPVELVSTQDGRRPGDDGEPRP